MILLQTSWFVTTIDEISSKRILFNQTSRDIFAALQCPNIGTPSNGQMVGNGVFYESIRTFSCDVGYELHGSTVRVCQDTGEWNGTLTTCRGRFLYRWAWLVIFLMLTRGQPFQSVKLWVKKSHRKIFDSDQCFDLRALKTQYCTKGS